MDYNDTTVFVARKEGVTYDFFEDRYFYYFHKDMSPINRAKYMYVLVRGIENGIFILYYFEKAEDSWQLIKENDSST